MDAFNSKEFYGHSLSDDPKLRTTTRNYEFKYNCSDHLEKVISRVKMDREKKKQSFSARNCIPPGIRKLCAPYSKKSSQIFKASSVETQIGKTSSTKVSVMSDAEIEAMIAQALKSNTCLPITNEASEACVPPKGEMPLEVTESKYRSRPKIEIKIPKCSIEFQSSVRPQWVEIKPAQRANASIIELPSSSSNTDVNVELEDISAVNLANDGLTKYEIMIEEKQTEDRLSFNSNMSYDFVLRSEDPAQQKDSPLVSPISFGLDSVLNDCERAEMERVLKKVLPHVPEMVFGNTGSQENSENSDEKEDPEDEESQEDATSIEDIERNLEPIVRINKQECRPKQPEPSGGSTRRIKLETTRLSSITPRSPKKDIHSPLKTKPPITPLDKIMQKQVEALKQEKIRIFSKMTSIQEKIIENLDNLRMSLLELSLPDGQLEKKLRERNAFEFSVRFSRNYLFPLGRMIEELRTAPNEEFRSATTNEACIKVCGIYGLLNQGLQCYHKQLRHFFIDSVPKKLDVFLKMIKDTTNICLQKKIFDKRDSLIQCLISRCGLFLEFVLQFVEEKSARESDMALKSGRRSPFKLAKTSSKWDLTMNLNNLNMYEPKLVPKKPKKKSEKQPMLSSREKMKDTTQAKEPIKPKEPNKSKESTKPKETTKFRDQYKPTVLAISKTKDRIALPAPDPVDTQVRKVNYAESVQLINTAIEEQPESELTKMVIETLQDITKDEVRQMLGPLVLNLGTILRNQDNPQTVESMLGVLNLQLLEKCKQLKIDAAAAENNTQNGNTYQKDVTKKGVNSIKGEQRKENRLKRRRLSKTKATSSTNNVYDGSTEQTESKNSPGGRTDNICDKQSLSNTDIVVAAADKNDSTKHKTPSRSVVNGGAFLSSAPLAVAAKKPTPPAPAAIRTGIPPPSLSAVSLGQLDEVMPPPPTRPPTTPLSRMTSQRVECSTSLPMMVPSEDKFAPECQGIGDGRYPKGYQRGIASESKIRYGAANTHYRRAADNQGACQRNPPSSSSVPARNEPSTSGLGQMEQLKYSNNTLYTFVKYCDQASHSNNQQGAANENDDIPDVECFTESSTRITTPKHSQNPSFKSLDSNQNLVLAQQQINEELENDQDIKDILAERENFIEQCKSDPLYTNPQFPQPWKVLSKISQNITGEIVENFGNDLSFGEESYVRDFINMEMQT